MKQSLKFFVCLCVFMSIPTKAFLLPTSREEGKVFWSGSKAQPLEGRAMKRKNAFLSSLGIMRITEDDPGIKDINVGSGKITGTTASIDFTNFDVSSGGLLTVASGINLSGGTAGAANTIDFGSGSDDDLTETDVTDLTDAGQTTLHSHGGGPPAGITLDDMYNNDGAGDAQITVDARDISIDLNDSSNDYKFSIDNTTGGGITTAMEVVTSGVGGTFTNGIDVSGSGITNAILVGANAISGTTATITFTDFQVSNDGNVVLAPDNAGDALTINLPAADSQAIVINAASNTLASSLGVVGINFATTTTNASAMDINMTVNDGAAAAANFTGINIAMNTTDADADQFGMRISAASTTPASTDDYEALIRIDNQDTTAGSMTDGIIITASGGDGTITTGWNSSSSGASPTPNVINVGSNIILGTTATMSGSDFSLSADGKVQTLPDFAGSTDICTLNNSATSGTQTDGVLIRADSGAVITTGVVVSDAPIVNAVNLGGNTLLGASGATIDIDGSGTQTFSFNNTLGGANEEVIVDMRTSLCDVRVPSATAAANGNGLYYDTTNNKLCVDDGDGTDRCTETMSLASFTWSEADTANLKQGLSKVETLQSSLAFTSLPLKQFFDASKNSFKGLILSQKDIQKLLILSNVEKKPKDLLVAGHVIQGKNYGTSDASKHLFMTLVGHSKLKEGKAEVTLDPDFLSQVDLSQLDLVSVYLTPASQIQGSLFISQIKEDSFLVAPDFQDKDFKSQGAFGWKITAPLKKDSPEKIKQYEKLLQDL